jgi:hypothetical protein
VVNFRVRFLFAAGLALTWVPVAAADLCSSSEIARMCPGDCPPLRETGPRDPVCERLFDARAAANAESERAVPASEPTGEDCSAYERASERIRCKREQGTLESDAPDCAQEVWKLIENAEQLVGVVQAELDTYGQILEKDFTKVENQEELCGYPLAQLDKFHKQAQENPAQLEAFRRQADAMQQCRVDWEAYERERGAGEVSGTLRDSIVRETDAKFQPLVQELSNLDQSIRKLESAEGQLYEMIGLHLRYCNPDEARAGDGPGNNQGE